jgi:hypothetical protein
MTTLLVSRLSLVRNLFVSQEIYTRSIIPIAAGIIQQYLMNPTAWNVKGYVGYVLFVFLIIFVKLSLILICLSDISGVELPY